MKNVDQSSLTPLALRKMTVAFVINDAAAGVYDGSNPSAGNPGIGGTQYCFLALAAALIGKSSMVKPVLYHNNPHAVMPRQLACKLVSGGEDALDAAVISDRPDIAVVRGGADLLDSPLSRQSDVSLIAWVHNYLPRKVLNSLGVMPIVKHVVFCGQEQRMLAYDTGCFSKSTAIFNMHYVPSRSKGLAVDENSAVYIGSIIPSKGLHRLLRVWPSVREQCPTARLHVIGSGALYNKKAKLGNLGIADSKYERKFLRYLRNLPDSYGVKFHGLLGHEKFSIMERCVVGIPNPTALTECCPGSVLECSSLGLPVVGRRKFGMVDTIVDDKTGFLIDTDKELVERIVYLFSNPQVATNLGMEGRQFVGDVFSADIISKSWIDLFVGINSREKASDQFQLKGSYIYKSLIARNNSGKHRLVGLFRDFLGLIETVSLKFR